MNKLVLSGIAIAALSVPALAQMAMPDHHAAGHKGHGPTTRAEAEAKVREHFAKLDGDKDGFVAREEVHASVERITAEKSGAHFDRMDADKNGSISRAEFDAAHKPGARHMMRAEDRNMRAEIADESGTLAKPAEHRGRRMVMRMHRGGHGRGLLMLAMTDADKDGRVSLQEAVSGSRAMFDRADANKDGTLTPEERKAARQAMRAEWRAKRGS